MLNTYCKGCEYRNAGVCECPTIEEWVQLTGISEQDARALIEKSKHIIDARYFEENLK